MKIHLKKIFLFIFIFSSSTSLWAAFKPRNLHDDQINRCKNKAKELLDSSTFADAIDRNDRNWNFTKVECDAEIEAYLMLRWGGGAKGKEKKILSYLVFTDEKSKIGHGAEVEAYPAIRLHKRRNRERKIKKKDIWRAVLVHKYFGDSSLPERMKQKNAAIQECEKILGFTETCHWGSKRGQNGKIFRRDLVSISVSRMRDNFGNRFIKNEYNLQGFGQLKEKERLSIILQILEQIKKLRDQGIILKDIKPDNVFFSTSEDGEIKDVYLADFGWRFKVENSEQKIFGDNCPPIGFTSGMTLGFIPIHLFEKKNQLSQNTARLDYFAFAVMIYILYRGTFPSEDYRNMMKQVYEKNGDLQKILQIPQVQNFLKDPESKSLYNEKSNRIPDPIISQMMTDFLTLPKSDLSWPITDNMHPIKYYIEKIRSEIIALCSPSAS